MNLQHVDSRYTSTETSWMRVFEKKYLEIFVQILNVIIACRWPYSVMFRRSGEDKIMLVSKNDCKNIVFCRMFGCAS